MLISCFLGRLGIALVAFLALCPEVHAGGPPHGGGEPPDAGQLIDECWAISEALRSKGGTGHMYRGTLETIDCLEEAILDQVGVLFEPNRFGRTDAAKLLAQLRNAHMELVWATYNEHRGCTELCGTMFHLFPLSHHAHLLEMLLKDLVQQGSEYRLY